MELKHFRAWLRERFEIALNRTKVELKQHVQWLVPVALFALNRTKVELKLDKLVVLIGRYDSQSYQSGIETRLFCAFKI